MGEMGRKMIIFIVSLPLLILAVVTTPLFWVAGVFAAPMFLMLTTLDWLRGDGFHFWRGIRIFPLFGVEMYLECTGLFPNACKWISHA